MTTVDFITALFYEVDEQLRAIPKRPEAHLWPSEVDHLGAAAGAQRQECNGADYYRLADARLSRACFPGSPSGPRLFRLFMTHQDWTHDLLGRPDGARRSSTRAASS